MGIWAGIKYALNSTLGTSGFKSLDKLIKDVMVNNYVTEEKTQTATTGTSDIETAKKPKLVISITVPQDAMENSNIKIVIPTGTKYVTDAKGQIGVAKNKTINTTSETTTDAFIASVDAYDGIYEGVGTSTVFINASSGDVLNIYILGYTPENYTVMVPRNSTITLYYNLISEYELKSLPSGVVKSIQRGTAKIRYRYNTTTVKINEVNAEKSVVLVDATGSAELICVGGVSSNAIRFETISDVSKDTEFSWQVIEFY